MTEAVANENSCLSGRLATRRAAGWLAALGRWRGTDDAPRPFHGYYFRPFTAQGPHAPGAPTTASSRVTRSAASPC
jgi:hypothetical protein